MTETEKVATLFSPLLSRFVCGALPSTELPILGSAVRAGEADDERGTKEKDADSITSRVVDRSLQKCADIVSKDNALILSKAFPESHSNEQAGDHQRIFVAELPHTDPAIHQTAIKCFTYLGLGASGASQNNGDNPVVVYEHPSYWVVRKPLGWPSYCGKGEEKASGPVTVVASISESLATFVRSLYPGINFPILWSRQHNFGVIFLLEESWFGLTVVAKSEEAFHSLEAVVESQLFYCYVECFVTGPPLRAVTTLYGKTAIAKAELCVEVLQSTVCRPAGGSVASSVWTHRSFVSVPNSRDVVSNVILRFNFPPALLSDILWCNGLTIAPDPYASKVQGTDENACIAKLCCFGISFPSFEIDNTNEACPVEESVEPQNTTILPRKKHMLVVAGNRVRDVLLQALSVLSTYKKVILYIGMIAAAPVALSNILSEARCGGSSTRSAAALVRRMLRKCNVYVPGPDMSFAAHKPCGFTTFASCNDLTTPPLEPEILFGYREGAPWLQLFESSA